MPINSFSYNEKNFHISYGYAVISKEEALKVGIKGYLMKPADRQKLANLIRKILDKKSVLDEESGPS